jgi:cyclic pyranopterin phosphate synthase
LTNESGFINGCICKNSFVTGKGRMKRLTHLDRQGRVKMVDVSEKPVTRREAVATGSVHMKRETLRLILDEKVPKGDVVCVARVAGIMAAKRAPDLIPLCHPLALASVTVELTPSPAGNAVDIVATCKVIGRTGVEMEALTAASVAALTVYDMCKAADRGIEISELHLLEKSGGESGHYHRGARGRK